jgi:hypothetical protein
MKRSSHVLQRFHGLTETGKIGIFKVSWRELTSGQVLLQSTISEGRVQQIVGNAAVASKIELDSSTPTERGGE